MIELKQDENLYFIRNVGCDDCTSGLAIMSSAEAAKFVTIVENLNKNSTYQCMPTINVYKVSPDMVEETEIEGLPTYDHLYLNGKVYKTTSDKYFWFEEQGEQIV